jgi:hypothetical protein
MENSTNRKPTELIPTANQQQPNEANNKGSKISLGVTSIDQTDPIQQAIKTAVYKVPLLNGFAAIESGKSTKHQHWQNGEISSFGNLIRLRTTGQTTRNRKPAEHCNV